MIFIPAILFVQRLTAPWDLPEPERNWAAALVFLLVAVIVLAMYSKVEKSRKKDGWRTNLPEDLKSGDDPDDSKLRKAGS